jgi:hypothetical protein
MLKQKIRAESGLSSQENLISTTKKITSGIHKE